MVKLILTDDDGTIINAWDSVDDPDILHDLMRALPKTDPARWHIEQALNDYENSTQP